MFERQLSGYTCLGKPKQFGHQRGGFPVDLVNPVFWVVLCVLGLAYVLALALRK